MLLLCLCLLDPFSVQSKLDKISQDLVLKITSPFWGSQSSLDPIHIIRYDAQTISDFKTQLDHDAGYPPRYQEVLNLAQSAVDKCVGVLFIDFLFLLDRPHDPLTRQDFLLRLNEVARPKLKECGETGEEFYTSIVVADSFAKHFSYDAAGNSSPVDNETPLTVESEFLALLRASDSTASNHIKFVPVFQDTGHFYSLLRTNFNSNNRSSETFLRSPAYQMYTELHNIHCQQSSQMPKSSKPLFCSQTAILQKDAEQKPMMLVWPYGAPKEKEIKPVHRDFCPHTELLQGLIPSLLGAARITFLSVFQSVADLDFYKTHLMGRCSPLQQTGLFWFENTPEDQPEIDYTGDALIFAGFFTNVDQNSIDPFGSRVYGGEIIATQLFNLLEFGGGYWKSLGDFSFWELKIDANNLIELGILTLILIIFLVPSLLRPLLKNKGSKQRSSTEIKAMSNSLRLILSISLTVVFCLYLSLVQRLAPPNWIGLVGITLILTPEPWRSLMICQGLLPKVSYVSGRVILGLFFTVVLTPFIVLLLIVGTSSSIISVLNFLLPLWGMSVCCLFAWGAFRSLQLVRLYVKTLIQLRKDTI